MAEAVAMVAKINTKLGKLERIIELQNRVLATVAELAPRYRNMVPISTIRRFMANVPPGELDAALAVLERRGAIGIERQPPRGGIEKPGRALSGWVSQR